MQVNTRSEPLEIAEIPFGCYTFEEASSELIQKFLTSSVFAFDIETDTNEYEWGAGKRGVSYVADMNMVSFGVDDDTIVCIAKAVYNVASQVTGFEFEPDVLNFIIGMFDREDYTCVAHNLVFDARQIFGKFNIPIRRSIKFWDTMVINNLGQYAPSDVKGSLLDLSTHYNLFSNDVLKWFNGMKKHREHMSSMLTSEQYMLRTKLAMSDLIAYSATDSWAALKVYEHQQIIPYDFGNEVFDSYEKLVDWELRYTKLCVKMSAKGNSFDTYRAETARVEWLEKQQDLLEYLGWTILQSRKTSVIKEFITSQIPEGVPTPQDIELHPELVTEKGAFSYGKDAITWYLNNFETAQLKKFKELKECETVIERIEEFIRHAEYDNRIHAILSRYAKTGRNTSSSPNLQNVDFNTFAGFLISDPGTFLAEFDYSNAENWAGNMYAQDSVGAYKCAEEDFHSAMAAAYFASAWEKADAKERKKLRSASKTITFGTAYGMGAAKLSRRLTAEGMPTTLEDSQAFLRNKDLAFQRTTVAKQRSSDFAAKNGYTILWTGRKVAIDKDTRGGYKSYTAWNSLSQGGISEIVVRACVLIEEFLEDNVLNSRIVNQVHDAIIVQIDVNEYDIVVPFVIECMATIVPAHWNERTTPSIRWLTDLDHSTNSKKWGLVHGMEYPFSTTTYTNRWGTFELGENSKAPVWINQYGYGAQAIEKELAEKPTPPAQPVEPAPTESNEVGLITKPNEPDWKAIESAIKDLIPFLNKVVYEGKEFDFANGMELRRALCHKGIEFSYLTILNLLGILRDNLVHQDWATDGGKDSKC